ncbi:MAG: protein phosphatase 2C domain-containing protein, partial [Anaerolineae bacterium]
MNFLQKLFTKEKAPPPTNSNSDEQIMALPPALPVSLLPGFHRAQKTDIGRQREQNQDSLYTVEAYIEANDGLEPFGIFIVADGMGGYKKGEIASELAVRASAGYILKNIYLPYLSKDQHGAAQIPINEVLTSAVIEANHTVLDHVPEAGTTLTIVVVMGRHAYLAHVGDSRAYLYHNGQLRQITQDHSLVARLVELGQATAEEAQTHPQRNVLYRAIGQTS